MDTVSGPNRHEEERLTHLVETYQLTLLRLCFAYLHDRALAEDAVQLSRIAVNTCRDMRRGAWFRHTDQTVTLDMLPEPSVSLSPRDDTITLAVMALPLKLRECVLLYYFQDMNTGEIADTLGISQQAVSTRLMRARGRLRKTLEQEEYERG